MTPEEILARRDHLIQTENEEVIVSLIMRLTGGGANPKVIRSQIGMLRETPFDFVGDVSNDQE